jgi:hypothetical protein
VGKEKFKSLSSAASSVSGHAERGGTTWRREGENQPLIGRPRYVEAGTTAALKPKAKDATKKGPSALAKKAGGTNGAVKTRKGVQCGVCKEWFANSAEASKHLAGAHPKS